MVKHILGATPDTGIPYQHLINAMKKEGDELSQRTNAISQFVQTPGYAALDILDKHLLLLQHETMNAYLHLLTIRMARFDEARKGVLPKGAGALGAKPLIRGGSLDS